MKNGYIKSTNGGVITAQSNTANSSLAVLNQGSGGFQKWSFGTDGYITLASSLTELCLSVSTHSLQNGSQVSLQVKGASGFLQKWDFDSDTSLFSLAEYPTYFLDSGSGGPAGPTVYVSTQANSKWTLSYMVHISPQTMIANYLSPNGPKTLINNGGTMTIGVMSNDSSAELSAASIAYLGNEIKAIHGGYAVTWILDKNNLSAMKDLEVSFTFKDSTTGNVSWNIFSLDFTPSSGPGVQNKFLPMAYIKTIQEFQNNLNNVSEDDFLLSGPGLTTAGMIPIASQLGPSGDAISVSQNNFQVFDTIVEQPFYLVQPPTTGYFNFIFRGDRPLGNYMVNGAPYPIDPTDKPNNKDLEKCAENQFIDFPKLYSFMKSRFNLQLPTSTNSFPTKIRLIDVSVTDLNQQYANIPTTDLPYQELRSFDKANYQPTSTMSEYVATLNSANLNMNLPATASINSFNSNGDTIQFTSNSKFAWVDIGTTNFQTFVPNKQASFYSDVLKSDYGIDAMKLHQFIVSLNGIMNEKTSTQDNTANIVFIHCNAGKMRTSTFLTCLFLTQHPSIKLEMAAYYAKSLYGDDAGNTRAMSAIGDYWGLVQNYCAYLDLVTDNKNVRNAAQLEPTGDPFTDPGSVYYKYPFPWQWKQAAGG